MKIYWSLKSVPELSELPRKQRRHVHEQCLQLHFFRARATARSLLAFLACLAVSAACVSLGVIVCSWIGIPWSLWDTLAPALVGFECGRFVLSRIAIPVLRPFYGEFIETARN